MNARIAGALCCGILLGGCAHAAAPSSLQFAPAAVPDNIVYKQLYAFRGAPDDGANPQAGVIPVFGALYGTTYAGGSNTGSCAKTGCGTIYEIAPSGDERVLYRFRGAPDGANPPAELISANDELYGTTEYGGTHCSKGGCGTLFELSVDGKERIIHSFGNGTDGFYPQAGLLELGGALYGTTTGNHGAVFKATTSGGETVLHQFQGAPKDGADPLGDLIAASGNIYGTTRTGGAANTGTLFEMAPSGGERVIHSFDFSKDGGYPMAGLLSAGGTLYGTASAGGPNNRGTVFAVTASGNVRVVHSFKGYPKGDGAYPYAGLIAYKGTLYGTTRGGGTNGDGTIFSLKPTGEEHVLYNFTVAPNGTQPYARLLQLNGVLYGTTRLGGKSSDGTVFRISP